jgi:hypothetical protein
MPDALATLEADRSKLLEEFLRLGDLRPGSICLLPFITRAFADLKWLC